VKARLDTSPSAKNTGRVKKLFLLGKTRKKQTIMATGMNKKGRILVLSVISRADMTPGTMKIP